MLSVTELCPANIEHFRGSMQVLLRIFLRRIPEYSHEYSDDDWQPVQELVHGSSMYLDFLSLSMAGAARLVLFFLNLFLA